MELVNKLKRYINNSKGATFIEIMVAVSILAISMVYVGRDSRYSSIAINKLNAQENMIYVGQEAVERFKLDHSGGTKIINGYRIDIDVVDDVSQDPNLTTYLKKAVFTIHHKESDSQVSDLKLVSYIFTDGTAVPDKPENLTATPAAASIILNWNSVTDADAYNIKRSEVSGGPYVTIASGITANSYTDNSVLNSTRYYYVVSASNQQGEGVDSNEASTEIEVNTIVLSPAADSYVNGGGSAGNNFGTSTILYVRNHNNQKFKFNSYLKFDLSSINGVITDARLRLYGYNISGSSSLNVNIQSVSDDSWTETGITWNNSPAPGSILDTMSFNGTRRYVEANITNYCISEYGSDKIASLNVNTSSSSQAAIDSREAVNKPQLVITWTPLQAPVAPSNLTAAPGDKQVALTWDTVIGASYYNIKRSTSTGGPYTIIETNNSTNSYLDTNLINGTTYYYVVSAENTTAESKNSNEASTTPNIIHTVTYYPEADSYVRAGIYSDNNFGSANSLEIRNGPTGSDDKRLAYLRFNLENIRGELLNAKLRLYGGNVEDSSTADLGIFEVLENSWEENTINHTNSPAPGNELARVKMDGIQTYREIDLTEYVKSEIYGDKLFNLAAVGKGLNKLLLINSREASMNKPELVITKTLLKPGPPERLTAVPDDHRVSLNWTSAIDADSYNIKRSTTDGGPYTTIASGVTSLTFTDTNVINGTAYYYVVSAVNASGESPNSVQARAVPNTTVTIILNPAADARVERYYPNKNYGNETLLGITNEQLNDKKTYIKFNLSGYSNNSVVSAKLRVYGKSSTGSFKVNAYGVSDDSWLESGAGGIKWSSAPELERTAGTAYIGTTQQYYEIDVTSYISEQFYSDGYATIGLFTDVISSDNVTLNSKETAEKPQLVIRMVEGVPEPPANLSAIGGNGSVSLSWTASDGAVSYKVKRGTKPGNYNTIASGVIGTSYTNTRLKNGSEYYYVVSAVNSKGESADSEPVCAIPGMGAGSQTLLPSDDTYIRDGSFSDNNFGEETIIGVSKSSTNGSGYNREAYIMFNLENVRGAVKTVTLEITGENTTNNKDIPINIYKVTDDSWDEFGVTWNQAPGNDILLGTIVVDHRYRAKSLDISNYVKTELAGDKKISICLKSSTANGWIVSFSSKEGNDPPLLKITY